MGGTDHLVVAPAVTVEGIPVAPTGALDHTSAHQLAALLTELNREEQVALVVVTHAADLAERMGTVYELTDGQLRRKARQ